MTEGVNTNRCASCEVWKPVVWRRQGDGHEAHHTGYCDTLLKILGTSVVVAYIESPSMFGCVFWKKKDDEEKKE